MGLTVTRGIVLASNAQPTFTRNSVAYLPDGTQVASGAPRFVAGKAGQALMVEEGTTNLVPANVCYAEPDASAFYVGAGTVSRDASKTWSGKASFHLVGGWAYTLTRFNVTPGNPITISAVVQTKTAGGQFGIWFYDSGGATVGSVATGSLSDAPITNWTRKSASGVVPANAATAAVFISSVDYAPSGNEAWFNWICVEYKPYATSQIDGGATRAAEILTAPLAVLSPAQGTVEWFGYTPNWAQFTQNWRRLFGTGNTNGSGVYAMYYYIDGKIRAHINNGTTTYEAATATLPSAGYHTYAMAYDSSGLAFYIDGSLAASVAGPLTLPSSFAEPAIGIMGRTDGLAGVNDVPTGALADAVRFSSRARTASEISAVANAYLTNGTPPAVDADTTYYLGFDGSLSPGGIRFLPVV
ncbi:MAG: hypothetical protein QJR08_04285 [Bacillota bacterium]|nr:hypothetical protein [Bacillota bacterium]